MTKESTSFPIVSILWILERVSWTTPQAVPVVIISLVQTMAALGEILTSFSSLSSRHCLSSLLPPPSFPFHLPMMLLLENSPVRDSYWLWQNNSVHDMNTVLSPQSNNMEIVLYALTNPIGSNKLFHLVPSEVCVGSLYSNNVLQKIHHIILTDENLKKCFTKLDKKKYKTCDHRQIVSELPFYLWQIFSSD